MIFSWVLLKGTQGSNPQSCSARTRVADREFLTMVSGYKYGKTVRGPSWVTHLESATFPAHEDLFCRFQKIVGAL